MAVKRQDQSSPSDLGAVIRKFRQRTNLTQAQLAVKIGIAPTSIYRYEAGHSSPDVAALQRLFLYADLERDEEAKEAFFDALCEKAGLDRKQFEQSLRAKHWTHERSGLEDVVVQGKRLTPREQMLTVAFVSMLRNNTDESSDKMLRLLLEPWMKGAKEEHDRLNTSGAEATQQSDATSLPRLPKQK